MRKLVSALSLFAAAAALGASAPASAETNFPTRHVTLVVPYAAGGPTDIYARLLAEPMSRHLGKPVVIENVGGAGGTIGTAKVAMAKPDGYTILIHQVGLPIGSAVYANLAYDAKRDLVGIGLINRAPILLLGRSDLPADNLQGLIKWMKEPGRVVKVAHAGVGSHAHMCGLLFVESVGVQNTQIPYRGMGLAMTDLMGGQVDLMCSSLNAAVHVRSGKMKAFGITSKERFSLMPELSTLVEAGYPGLVFISSHALYTRAGTPPEVLAKLTAALQVALKDEKVIERFKKTGVEAYPVSAQTPEATTELLKSEIVRWTNIVEKHKIPRAGK